MSVALSEITKKFEEVYLALSAVEGPAQQEGLDDPTTYCAAVDAIVDLCHTVRNATISACWKDYVQGEGTLAIKNLIEQYRSEEAEG